VEWELALDATRAREVAAAYPELAQYAPEEFRPREPATDEEFAEMRETLWGD